MLFNGQSERLVAGFPGCTIACRVAEAAPFRPTMRTCSDVAWCIDMTRSGRSLYATSSKNFVKRYFGPGKHLFNAPFGVMVSGPYVRQLSLE